MKRIKVDIPAIKKHMMYKFAEQKELDKEI